VGEPDTETSPQRDRDGTLQGLIVGGGRERAGRNPRRLASIACKGTPVGAAHLLEEQRGGYMQLHLDYVSQSPLC
jgi:hypothetical protein